ncbi:acetoin dehydrogenase E1 component (TPP-dependent beta subunit) [Frankia canadensis]|uniref:Acetoin dehydrogenase E1 component (TPP-dependent beta subunit) n=2 Tax=Frankia canadensis TaxID=1836972 RepID=A0A2I2L2R9_9ACTN|nr:alpha-ketoacid dehydrogenase subunit beta [Frankia canadensis]SNQ52223.1 acetoin dehydrogenase E1 component (TPP-dependent beta subunit) [Frankia canadensis]SOU59513.1 acetoin dehydrogenase E1 component (TPP-dependent beta subunit) [Frankia canadensis]
MSAASARKITFQQAYNEALDEAMAADDSVFVLGEDVGDKEGGGTFKVTSGLSTKYGTSRVRTTPISEQAIIGTAVGAAVAGMRPVAEIMLMNFITLGLDQLVNHAAKLRYMSGGQTGVPLTVRTATGAGGGFGGQHSDMLEAWLAHVPGLKVVVPSSPADAKGLLLSSIFDDDPCVVIEHTQMYWSKGPAPEPGVRIPLGRAHIARPGRDISVIAYGRPVGEVLALADRLAGDGIEVEVVDLRTISPLDERTVLESVARTRRAVIVHEAVGQFGVGAEISARIGEELHGDLASPVVRVTSANTPVPFSPALESRYLYQIPDVESAIRKACQ